MGWVPFLEIFEHLVSPTLFQAYPKAKCRFVQTQRWKIPPQGGIFKHLVSPTYNHAYPKAKCRYDQIKHGKIPCRKAKMGWVPFLGIFEHLVSLTSNTIYPKAKCRLRMSEIEMSVKTHKE